VNQLREIIQIGFSRFQRALDHSQLWDRIVKLQLDKRMQEEIGKLDLAF